MLLTETLLRVLAIFLLTTNDLGQVKIVNVVFFSLLFVVLQKNKITFKKSLPNMSPIQYYIQEQTL